ncbi:ATP-dependent DNA ligase, partial [Enterobacter kobei]|uniref:ATP-dependent DNA ligase n=1 Tax=Enterobacter kobei TaxID=208224 RepID=UPI001953F2C1
PLPFALLQTRIGRKNISKKQLEEVPIAFFAYDLLEWQDQDIRDWPLEKRVHLLSNIVNNANLPHQLLLSKPIQAT